ncbi:hypothetical protein GCM10012288_10730 [Malaciobacter pacificus]|jgi:flagellar hook-associated protein 1 FlgK|uniref:Flagellar hook-associated protein 1 n=1 Tax=Malaciobacter pacificus TaxID=1080223 RepID=A0A5C2HAX5_9BACT|nr:flagellar hook-associated protein FlgK [Malaciobacter pacificus]QEP35378.1 proximal flagellar hook-filament junction protein [Malaciobacter pacificus]GGD38556.1 hypothetical protein GCM10012288_10730 [Malaciobacter pacificus]
MLNSINVSSTGLSAAKTAVENVSNNIANENTPGYKKRVVQLSELEHMDTRFTGRGVDSSSAYRITDQYMFDKLLSENTTTNYYDKLSSMLGNVESIFSETDSSGFSSDLDRYFQSVENLRSNPNSEVYRTTLISHGNALVDSMQNLYSSIEQQQKLERSEINENVDIVNNILKDIGLVNQKLGQLNESSNDLLDKRDQLETELAKYVDIEVDRTDGDYELSIAGVVAVRFNTNVRDVSIDEEKITQVDKYVKDNSLNESIIELSDGVFNNGDTLSYKLNNEHEVSVTYGETFTDNEGNSITVGSDNYIRALVAKINVDPDMNDYVTAYNGTRYLDSSGELITDDTQDNYLRIESNIAGLDGSFDGRISLVEDNDTNITDDIYDIQARNTFYKDDYQSTEAEDRVYLAIYGQEISAKDGIIKAQVENLSSDSYNNKYQSYLDKLDAFAKTLSDLTDSYIQTGTDEYIYGENASEKSLGTINEIGLFSGSSVSDLRFNSSRVNDLNQQDLDYLATMQWKKDISFTGKEQDSTLDTVTSLAEFFQDIKVGVSSDVETNNFLLETQENVELSLKSSYDQLVKVDKDEEMINLMKFQSAYTANAKVVTAIDEMIQVLLGLKR